ncbi:DUF6363 domain-containing protein [Lentibacillus halophilus]|uniref:DUF6363 domain-containing protein n=1 Tax=Lentibacillus halophilus TaxID=295065 RepID=UPI003CD0B9EA
MTASRIEKSSEKLKLLYQQGYQTAEKNFDALQQFLEQPIRPSVHESPVPPTITTG